MAMINIPKNIDEYLKERHPEKRYASFDYCFNYFRTFIEFDNICDIASTNNIQLSCLHLAFYLASWGMLRGSSFLLQKSIKHYEVLIYQIAKLDRHYWEIDVDDYSDKNISLILGLYDKVEGALGDNDDETASVTLITKIMLGVFGNVPALDQNFCKGFGYNKYFSKSLLRKIADYYDANKGTIDTYRIHTIDYQTGTDTAFLYSKAKLIDMIGFIEGLRTS